MAVFAGRVEALAGVPKLLTVLLVLSAVIIDAGRVIMLKDLESMHGTLVSAWKAVNLVSGIDLDALVEQVTKTAPEQ